MAGWPVLPLHPRQKTPLGSLVYRGSLDASTDPDTIRGWWRKYPDANIGLRTGVAFEVLDIDGPEAVATLLTHSPGYQHPGPVSATGKGWHLLFAVSGAKNAAKLSGVPLDYRGLNGYIVAPPSIHPDGHRYLWRRDRPETLPEIPDWLRTLLFPPPPEKRVHDIDDALGAIKAKLPPIIQMVNLLAKGPILPSGQKNGGAIWKTNCFLGTHSDSDPSFMVYEWDESFFCQGCRDYGDQLNLQNFINTGRLR